MKASSLTFNIALALATLIASVIIVVLKRNGAIDGEMAQRALCVVLGIILVVYANFIPKQIARGSAAVKRFTGWTFVAAYLSYAAIWAFAPMEYALAASMSAVGAALVLTLAYCALKRRRAAT